jgi:3-isopropylmalate dehydrogenase|tara:strand:- start:732 stop:1799 length:1068 start_codon:yes stop_codon:yes gene_type:complete
MKLLLLAGDGIGPEISYVTRKVLEALGDRFNLGIELIQQEVGFSALEKFNTTLPDKLLHQANDADGIILGPLDTAAYPPADQGGINVSAVLRKHFDLFANIRPAKSKRGIDALAPAMDLVLVRENTEGFYADRTMFSGSGEFMPTSDLALSIRKISRDGSYRIGKAAATIAAGRPSRKLTIVTKSNALKVSDGLFLEACTKGAAECPNVELEEIHVDAMASLLVRTPEAFDVVVTTNMFGDILSNLANELSGGLGLGGSLNAGSERAIAQASHGSAPDIEGKDIGNPVALILSTAMLLDWLGEKKSIKAFKEAALLTHNAVDSMLLDRRTRTSDLGGGLGTKAFGEKLVNIIKEA